MSSAMPTTVVHGLVSVPTLTHWPSGSALGHNTRPMDSLTTMTRGAPARSASVYARPRTMRVPIVAKYSDDEAWYVNRPSRATVSIPATNNRVPDVLRNGTL